jgi:heterodisulfide reductase subunit A
MTNTKPKIPHASGVPETTPITRETVSGDVLVIGGGIAGIQASLDLANGGAEVILVEREPSIGGKMAALDKNFPTLDCSICIEAPKMSDVIQHDNIEVMTMASVTDLEGRIGNFTAKVYQQPRYVTDACTECDDCVEACPEVTTNEFDEGMGSRKAIYTPFDQAEPGDYVIDMETCLNEPPNRMACDRCARACKPDAIDFDMTGTDVDVEVSAVVAATGFDLLNPQVVDEYGYGEHPDIVTSLEYERLLDASGPTEGHIVRPSTGTEPENVMFVLCVGSRDERHAQYCSRTCCMYSTKQALQTMDHGIDDVETLYMDMRAYGKNFDDFYLRARDEGAEYHRGRPAEVDPAGDRPTVRYEDTMTGDLETEDYDMVVLSPAMIPSDGTAELADTLGIELDDNGFIEASEADGDMIETTRAGVFAAGAATGPKDIPDSVSEASGAASKALEVVEERSWPDPIDVESIDATGDEQIGVFVCDCGSNIAGTVDVPDVVDWADDQPGVEHAEELPFACAGSGTDRITDAIEDQDLNRAVVAACSPKTHLPTFQRAAEQAGLNQYLVEMANIRNHDSWVHDDGEAATEKAKDLVKMGVDKARFLEPLEEIEQPIEQRALVVGGGIAGISSAISLANQGHETHLVERDGELGGVLRHLDELHPSGRDADDLLEARIAELEESGVTVHTETEVENVSGYVGNFAVDLDTGRTLDVGAVVLATGAEVKTEHPIDPTNETSVMTNLELEQQFGEADGVEADSVTLVGCVGSRNGDRGCSRYCCQSMIGQANRLNDGDTTVNVVSKDIRTFTKSAEEAYRDAAREGVRFFRYDEDSTPDEALDLVDGDLVFDDQYSGKRVGVPSDLVVSVEGLEATGVEETNDVAAQLAVSRDEEDFLLERHPKLGPAEASVPGVFMAGSAQYPKDVRDATNQALGAAAKAGALLAKDTVEQEPLAAQIDAEACIGCTRCTQVCPYNAIEGDQQETHSVVEAACMGCGVCAPECPTDAIEMPGFTDDQIEAQIDAALETDPEETVVTFACNWCSYAGADQAGIEKREYPPNARIIRTMCSGRVDEEFVDYAFEQDAGGVLLSGCHIGDCHYIDANEHTETRYERKKSKLERDEEFDEDRFQLEWVSAAEGQKFADAVSRISRVVEKPPTPTTDGGNESPHRDDNRDERGSQR